MRGRLVPSTGTSDGRELAIASVRPLILGFRPPCSWNPQFGHLPVENRSLPSNFSLHTGRIYRPSFALPPIFIHQWVYPPFAFLLCHISGPVNAGCPSRFCAQRIQPCSLYSSTEAQTLCTPRKVVCFAPQPFSGQSPHGAEYGLILRSLCIRLPSHRPVCLRRAQRNRACC